MDVRAIVLVGGAQGDAETNGNAETMAGTRLAVFDVLGRSVLARTIDRLQQYRIQAISVVGEIDGAADTRRSRPDIDWLPSTAETLWRDALATFHRVAQNGAEAVVIVRLGPYSEIDFDHFLQFHLDNGARVTAAVAPDHELADVFVVSAQRRNDAAFLLRSHMREFRAGCCRYPVNNYFNPLRTPADLRRLATDAFRGKADLQPIGEQVRPGVWVAPAAHVQRGARLLAPCYVGTQARIRPNAVVTRCSAIEHHAVVESGSVIDDATLLPHTQIGAALDITSSVVGAGRVANLRRKVEVDIMDPRLVGETMAAPMRALHGAASLALFVPFQFFRGIFNGRGSRASIGEAVQAGSAALKQNPSYEGQRKDEFVGSELMVARRYGNQ